MPGPPPKPSTPGGRRRRDRRGLGLVTPLTAAPAETPAPPSGLAPKIVAEWTELWESPIAQTLLPTDLPTLRRVFWLRDEVARLGRAYRRNRFVPGSNGQPVLSPAAAEMNTLLAELRQLEDRVGLSPMARLKLGIRLGAAATSLAALAAQTNGPGDDEADPRLDEDLRLSDALDASSRTTTAGGS